MEDKIKELIEGIIKDAKEKGADVKVIEIKDQKIEEQKEGKYIHLDFEDDGLDAEIKNCDAASMFLAINHLAKKISKQTNTSISKTYELAKNAHVLYEEFIVGDMDKNVD